ncbi:MAG TPA: NUDIX hydrolase [Steroidobacter sp.]|jgi:ADP-ribose pyrophosphatase|nr:NUDIX hydrolase [Steroidobacteraceae bacterium]HLS82763.1 NUDIX hydrolase [Steroidobacter sp.]
MSAESIRNIFTGRVISVSVERVRLPNQAVVDLEIVRHPGGAAIVALDDQDRACLLRQYRHAAGGWIWELPAGKIDHGEPPLKTAQRELEEEAGAIARRWRSLGEYFSSPGVCTEVIHLYLATALEPATLRPEAHEVIEVHWTPFDRVLEMAYSGELRDGKSLVGVFRAAEALRRSPLHAE